MWVGGECAEVTKNIEARKRKHMMGNAWVCVKRMSVVRRACIHPLLYKSRLLERLKICFTLNDVMGTWNA